MHNIAIVNLTSIFGGGEKFIADVFFPLESNFNIHYLLRNKELYDQCEESRRVFLPSSKIRALKAINAYLGENKIEAVILNGNGAIYFAPFIKCKNIIAYKHTGWQSVNGILKKIIYSVAINISYIFCKKIIAVSQSIRPLSIWKDKTDIIHNGVDINFYKQTGIKKPEILQIVFIGRIYKQKGVFELFEAIKELSSKYAFKMLYVGEGPDLNILSQKAKSFKLDHIIEFIGFTNNVKYYLENSHIFVLPSYYESCGLSILESMSMGVPVISGNKGGPNEIIKSGEDGLLFDPHNIDELIAKLESLILSENLRTQLSKNARIVVEQKFDINNTISKVAKMLSNL